MTAEEFELLYKLCFAGLHVVVFGLGVVAGLQR